MSGGESFDNFVPKVKGNDANHEANHEEERQNTLAAEAHASLYQPKEKVAEVKTNDVVADKGVGKFPAPEHCTPEQNCAAIQHFLSSAAEKMEKLYAAGHGDAVQLVSEQFPLKVHTKDDVASLMKTIRDTLNA